MDELFDAIIGYRPPQSKWEAPAAPAGEDRGEDAALCLREAPLPTARLGLVGESRGGRQPLLCVAEPEYRDGPAAAIITLLFLAVTVCGALMLTVFWVPNPGPFWNGPTFARSTVAAARAAAPADLRDAVAAAPAPASVAAAPSRVFGLASRFSSVQARADAEPAAARGPAKPAAAVSSGRLSFHDLVMSEREKMRKVWFDAIERSPVVRAYVREWRSTPELAALTARWHEDHDPVAFAKGLVGQSKFYELAAKYGRSPDMLDVVKRDVAAASPQAIDEVSRAMNNQPVAQQLLDGVSGAVGLPLGPLAKAALDGYRGGSVR